MLLRIDESNQSIFDLLVQDYEEEFAPITGKIKNSQGFFALDTDWREPNKGYYFLEKGEVAGFCIVGFIGELLDVHEFYVVPSFRRKNVGEKMASSLFNTHPGKWQVRQIEGADVAKAFWRRVIGRYTKGDFVESAFEDPYWGFVTCQRFENLFQKI